MTPHLHLEPAWFQAMISEQRRLQGLQSGSNLVEAVIVHDYTGANSDLNSSTFKCVLIVVLGAISITIVCMIDQLNSRL